MASPVKDSQPTQVISDAEKEQARLKDIWALFTTGTRIQICTHVLECLLMTLSVIIVNNSTCSSDKLDNQKVENALKTAREECTKRCDPQQNACEKLAMELLKDLESFDNTETNDVQKRKTLKIAIASKTQRILDERKNREKASHPWKVQSLVIDKSWKVQKSPLFTEVAAEVFNIASPLSLLQGDALTKVLQKLKVAAVHEICVNLEVGWALFHNAKNCGFLFCKNYSKTLERYVTAQGPLTAYEVMEYLSNERHYSAHSDTLPEGTETPEHHDFEIFLDQYTAMIKIMKPYFDLSFQIETQPLEEKKHLQYLFPGIIENQVDIGLRLAECYPNLVEIINDRLKWREENKDLDQQITDLKKGKQKMDEDLLSIIQCHSDSDSEILRDLKKLLSLLSASPRAVVTPTEDDQLRDGSGDGLAFVDDTDQTDKQAAADGDE